MSGECLVPFAPLRGEQGTGDGCLRAPLSAALIRQIFFTLEHKYTLDYNSRMQHLRDPNNLTPEEIEAIEKQSLRSLYTAAFDFGFDAFDIFAQSSDDPKDIAEDITREMLDRLGGYQLQQRILGNVDYRKARYIILSEFSVRQALFVDSKAEKSSNSATMQMFTIGIVRSSSARWRRG